MSDENPRDPATRIFGVVARAAPVVVLIRRGPSKHVLLLTWNTLKHEFRAGQWLKGRIYEERCDLSPSGDKLIYLAANHRGELGTWTAISRPPFLTALALWDNLGTWGGGGLFHGERVVSLNKSGSLVPQPGFRMPRGLQIRPVALWAGRGEDDPIRSVRMKRDGWTLEDAGVTGIYKRHKGARKLHWEYERPEVWHKARNGWILERRQIGIGERDGPWRVNEHRLLDPARKVAIDLSRSDWADWSSSDELLLAMDGRVNKMHFSVKDGPGALEELIDLRPLRFEQVPPPTEATTWHQKVEGRRLK
ncbi:MAG: hypothetical protein H7Y89_07125 [Steroidobacteraceae bacterium]|nr:hypothetical protein [Steroidobacteraceae bacterium]